MSGARESIITRFAADRRLAHGVLFAHRHPVPSAGFHEIMIDDWHSPSPRIVEEGFRDCAKSTVGEEAVCLAGGFREFRNCLIVGSTGPRAAERLGAIQHELEHNDDFREVFGDLRGPIWAVHTAQILDYAVIQAVGVGQSLRGIKWRQFRPDLVWIEDIEDEESVRTPEARLERLRWVYKVLIPACAKNARIRFTGNRLDSAAVIAEVSRDPDWVARRFPIRFRNEAGDWEAAWSAMFDLEWIEKSRASYARMGLLADWECEYMCEADAANEQKAFKPDFWKVRPQPRHWQATYAMYDPARTVNAASATTAKAVWSYVGPKIVVWEGWAKKAMPSEIIIDVFETDARHQPVVLGVEEDGLNEWLKQPIRAEMVKRGHALPNLKPVKAPVGKLDFIKGLEPLATAGELEFAFEDAQLKAQFLNFPKQPIDFPNALAYALKLRPGLPIYEEFSERLIVEKLLAALREQLWLAMNAASGHVSAVLVQAIDGIRILGDWIREGEPGQVVPSLIKDVSLFAGGAVPVCVGGALHFDQWNNLGLRQAVRKTACEFRKGVDWPAGRAELRDDLRRELRGRPYVLISSRARWTLNALAGGYALPLAKAGLLGERAGETIYRTLMEGLESFIGLLKAGIAEPDDDIQYATTRDGRRYVCAMPGRA